MSPLKHAHLRSLHYQHSQLRERIVEFAFMGEIMRRLWQSGITDVEILRSDFDAFGYDVVLTHGSVVRHVQLKTVLEDGATREWKIATALADKPSGCVVVCVVSLGLDLKSFLWFGGAPDEQLPLPEELKVARHTKGNSLGEKLDRPAHRVLPKKVFSRPLSMDELIDRLFGAAKRDGIEPLPYPERQPD